jgi:HSP20 family protein
MAREQMSERGERGERNLARPEAYRGPSSMIERLVDEVDRVFDEFGLGRTLIAPKRQGSWLSNAGLPGDWTWTPAVEVFHRDSELVVRADLPGLTKDDVKVDVAEDRLTIQGERKQEHREEQRGIYRSERSYGTFCREVILPTGAMSDQAKATFKDGVLEITIPAPPESARRGRRLEISGDTPGKK